MKLSLNWLGSYFPSKPDWDVIFDKLTMSGIEIENIEILETDKIVEFKITPNRGDCLSVNGILREISVLCDYSPSLHNIDCLPIKHNDLEKYSTHKIQINIESFNECPDYISLTIKNINNNVKLPDYIYHRLLSAGYSSISPIADITNYVMLQIGQPLHAFDLDRVGEQLSVRLLDEKDVFNNASSSFTLLDGTKINLLPNTLVVFDDKNNPVALAGVMGGKDSSVTSTTTNIVLESAFFVPQIISGVARKYRINSDSAYRFERGVDPRLIYSAILYAKELIKEFCGGDIGHINRVISKEMPERVITLSFEKINKVIGVSIKQLIIIDILTRLGFGIIAVVSNIITIKVPTYRFDILIEEDVVEEIARVYGYDNIPAITPYFANKVKSIETNKQQIDYFKLQLANMGYNEIINYAFLEEKQVRLFTEESKLSTIVKLKNPIANWGALRNNLFADIMKTLQYNVNRGVKSARLFEVGRVFLGVEEEDQPLKIAGLIYGNYSMNLNSMDVKRPVDFFDIKHDVQILLRGYSNISFVPEKNYSIMHSGRCAKIILGGVLIGVLGQLHPVIGREFDLQQLPYLFELDIEQLQNQKNSINKVADNLQIRIPYKFPKVERDLAFVVSYSVCANEIIKQINQNAIPYLLSANIFDVYCGEGLPSKMKSVAINFMFQANKTLTDNDISASLNMVKKIMLNVFAASLR